MVSKVGAVPESSVVLVLVVQVVSSVRVCVVLKVLRQVHLRLVGLMARVAVQQAMVLPMAAVVEHAVRVVSRRVRARRAVRGRRVDVGLEQPSGVANRRAVAVGVQVPGVLVLVEILAAGMEPVETICHHRAAEERRERLSWLGARAVLRRCRKRMLQVSGGRGFWPAKSSSLVHEHQPRSA